MKKNDIVQTVEQYLADTFYCTLEDLNKPDVVFTINPNVDKTYMKIMAYKNSVVICASENMSKQVQKLLSGKSRDEIFECPLVYGQTIHYIPDVDQMKEIKMPDGFTYELLEGEEIGKLSKVQGFDNSLVFDQDGTTSTRIAIVAKKDDKAIAIAGAGIDADCMWEVGVDVLSDYRDKGLGSALVCALTMEILKRGVVPFYSASVTNIGSQRVAARVGYVPYWVDTFGNVYDENYVYGNEKDIEIG